MYLLYFLALCASLSFEILQAGFVCRDAGVGITEMGMGRRVWGRIQAEEGFLLAP